MRVVEISPAAEDDLADIEEYSTRMWGPDRAARYIYEIAACIDRLAEDPVAGRRRGLPAPLIADNIGRHVVIVRDNPDGNRLEVVRVLHQAMNLRARLAGRVGPLR